jgi:cyclopropane fatty-acyl-phospholipid synthase-like methyltransferase
MDVTKDITSTFFTNHYAQINNRRLEHLASLHLDLCDKTVLELGAGVGDLSSFFLDRNCQVTALEAREENLAVLKQRWPQIETSLVDFDQDDFLENDVLSKRYDIVFSYGILYHLQDPARLIRLSARNCKGALLLETCVSPGKDESINRCDEDTSKPTQSYTGVGCRPSRPWILKELKKYFPYVYSTRTQPFHNQFPLDWNAIDSNNGPHTRSIFIASRTAISNRELVEGITNHHDRL